MISFSKIRVAVLATLVMLCCTACDYDPFDPPIGPRNEKKAADRALEGVSWLSPTDRMHFLERKPINPAILMRLAENRTPAVRALVAINTATPDDLLYKLANDSNVGVRQFLVQNRTISRGFLLQIKEKESSPLVLETMVGNPAWTSDDLWQFYRAGSARYNIAINPSSPPDLLAELLHSEQDDRNMVLSGLELNPHISSKLLEQIVRRAGPQDRAAKLNALNHPALTPEVCYFLQNDADEDVRWNVQDVLQRSGCRNKRS